MKIKVKPEDFIVEEIIDAVPQKKGEYALYKLRKKEENTVETLRQIAGNLRLPFSNFAYGGRKDKHALAFQHITIKSTQPRQRIEGKNYSLDLLGFLDRPMEPDLIAANRFTVTIRSLSEAEVAGISEEIPLIESFGFPNYFDDQRFGSLDPRQGFLAEKILKKHYNGALKIYLTRLSSQDRKEDRERKEFFFENWDHPQNCLRKARTPFEKAAFGHLEKKPKDFIFLLRKIPREDLSLYYSSYQAFLWNEVLRRGLKLKVKDPLKLYKGLAGDYFFYTAIDSADLESFKNSRLFTPASNIKISDAEMSKLYGQVLEENNLRLPMFNITKIRHVFFKGVARAVCVTPRQLTFDFLKDDVYQNHHKCELRFLLPRGSYATMLVKRLFAVTVPA